MSTDDATENAEAGADGESDAPAKGKGKILKIVLLLLVGIVSLSIGLIAAVGIDGVKGAISGPAAEEASDEADRGDEHEATSESEEDEAHYSYLNFDEMIVNITGYTASGRRTSRFMKIKVTMVYEDHGEEAAADLEEKKIFMRDSFQDYLRQLDERDLQGSYGLVRLRSELLKRAKAVVGNESPQEVLIGDLIIQ